MIPDSSRPGGEELLEAVLRGESPDEGASTEHERLRAFVEACREVTGDVGELGELTERALSMTTREDLSWRGDLRVLTGFVREGVRSSVMLRLAAASLLLHIAALPVVALFILTEDPVVPEFRVELGRQASPFVDSSEVGVEVDDGLEIAQPQEMETLLVENSLRWSRWQLSRLEDPRLGVTKEAPVWLEERATVLWGGESQGPTSRTGPDADQAAPYEWVFEVERRLDQHLVGPRARGFTGEDRALLDRVSSMVAESQDAPSWLAAATLARAESYGLVSERATESLSRARAKYPLKHSLRPLIEIEGDVRKRLPLDPLWVEALRDAHPAMVSEGWLEHIRLVNSASPR